MLFRRKKDTPLIPMDNQLETYQRMREDDKMAISKAKDRAVESANHVSELVLENNFHLGLFISAGGKIKNKGMKI